MIDESKDYVQYALDVISGKEVACKYVKLACQRFIDWFDRTDIYFDFSDVDRKIRFVNRMKHTEAPFSGQPFNLLPFQKFIFAGIFGWKYKETNERVTNKVLLMISRKNGKTALAAALMLATIVCDGQMGLSGYTISNSGRQAAIAFKHVKEFSHSLDPDYKIFDKIRSTVRIPCLNSTIDVLNSDTQRLDGLNPSIFVVDEYHAAKTPEVFNILQTGAGARRNALSIIISTAGFLVGDEYPLYAQWKTSKQILEGTIEDDSWFSMLYQLDDDDDWKDENVWKKASPSLGVTVTLKYMREQIQSAIQNPMLETSVKTKNLNMFCNSSETWIPYENIEKTTKKFELTDFDPEEQFCFVGFDLSDVDDMTVLTTLVYNETDQKYYFKAFPYICKTGLEKSPNKELYYRWIKQGYLKYVDVPVIDHDYIVEQIKQINEQLPIAYIGYDPWRSKQVALKCYKEGIPMHKVSQSIANFTTPTREMAMLILQERAVLDDNPVIRWCFSNVVMSYDMNGNCKPSKISKASSQKIDIVISFIMTIALWDEIYASIVDLPDEVTVLS